MPSPRTSDLAILLGHVLQCEMCRDRLLEEPERVMVGRKLTALDRERLEDLTPQSLESAHTLAATFDLDLDELREGMNHPRARLRHL